MYLRILANRDGFYAKEEIKRIGFYFLFSCFKENTVERLTGLSERYRVWINRDYLEIIKIWKEISKNAAFLEIAFFLQIIFMFSIFII